MKYYLKKTLRVKLPSKICFYYSVQINNPGLFKNKYIVYTIATPLKDFAVERRYSEFDELREILQRNFLGYVIPPLPPKKVISNLSTELIKKRKIGLELFLNDLLMHPVLKHSEFLLKFLSVSKKEWEIVAKNFKDSHFEYITVQGKAKIAFTETEKQYCDKIFDATVKVKEAYNELRDVHKSIINDFESISKSMLRASILYENIAGVYFNLEDEHHSGIFFRMNEGWSKLSKAYSNYADNYSKSFGHLFSFYKYQMPSLTLGHREQIASRSTQTGNV